MEIKSQPVPIIPNDLRSYYDDWKMSPAIISDGHIFFTGFTGVDKCGDLPKDFESQIRNAFEKVKLVLNEVGLSFEHLVEMTSYHVDIQKHLELFKSIRSEYVVEPYPAWTTIQVSGFVREGAIVEIKATAQVP